MYELSGATTDTARHASAQSLAHAVADLRTAIDHDVRLRVALAAGAIPPAPAPPRTAAAARSDQPHPDDATRVMPPVNGPR